MQYKKQGCVFPVSQLFTEEEVLSADLLLTDLVQKRPAELAPEDLLNLHMTHPEVLALCRYPKAVAVARALLDCQDVSVFTSRVLCKMPGTGKEVPWHQDSHYWPLVPPGESKIRPVVASLWLALDNVDEENGAMEVLPFEAQPETRNRNCTEFVENAGGNTDGFNNFNLSIRAEAINANGAKLCCLKRGDTEWHSAWMCHRSGPNKSNRRRMAWIVRYVPTGTIVVGGIRGSFDDSYEFVSAIDATSPPKFGQNVYTPCFGNSSILTALKK
jgi:ectoine hydroxylase-related dioxygenase (phytanoyl-CoA dioxygenase family)